MKKSTLFYFAAWALFCPMAAKSQHFFEPSEVTVRLGERLPESFFDTVHDAVDMKTGAATQVRLGDYRNKLIILDFWATWCGPCLGSLNKLDTIMRELNDPRFVVIPVTGQSAEMIKPIIKRYAWDRASIVGDSTLARIFPHDGIPHMVWIKDDRVVAIPHAIYATKENITAVLNGQQPHMMMDTKDRVLDPLMPLFVKGNGDARLGYEGADFKIAGPVRHYRNERAKVVHKDDSTIVYCANQPALGLLQQAYALELFPNLNPLNGGFDLKIGADLKHWLTGNPPSLSPDNTPAQDSAYLAWYEQHAFSYERRIKGRLSEREALQCMQRDIGEFFRGHMGLSARIVPGPLHRYGVLRLHGTQSETLRLLTEGILPEGADKNGLLVFPKGKYNSQLFFLMARTSLEASPGLGLTTSLIDSTGIDPDTDVRIFFPKELHDGLPLEEINRQLGRYGLYIELEEKHVPILELTEIDR